MTRLRTLHCSGKIPKAECLQGKNDYQQRVSYSNCVVYFVLLLAVLEACPSITALQLSGTVISKNQLDAVGGMTY